MKLSQIVRLLNTLDQQHRPEAESVCQRELGELLRVIDQGQPRLPNRLAELEQDYRVVKQSIETFCQHVDATRNEILQLIESLQPSYLAESYRLHDKEMINDSDQLILNRQPSLSPSVENYLLSRMAIHSDWHHAALVIRPGTGQWLSSMVGADPLYLADIRSSLLSPSVSQFNLDYQRRLRQYVIRENDSEGHVLRDLPDGQFGFCVALNFFHYKPFEIIKLYLNEIYRKLKPGGVLAFTFNDCDLWGGVELAERSFMCYTPGGMVCALCESLGFEMTQRYAIDNANIWLEMKKPGVLTSIRGGQCLAKIIANQ